MIKVLRKVASNRKGSEVVEKIAITAAMAALAVAVISFIVTLVNKYTDEDATVDADGKVTKPAA